VNAEMTGGALAGLLACPLYGDHAEWLDPLFPWGDKHHDKNVACHSAVSDFPYIFLPLTLLINAFQIKLHSTKAMAMTHTWTENMACQCNATPLSHAMHHSTKLACHTVITCLSSVLQHTLPACITMCKDATCCSAL